MYSHLCERSSAGVGSPMARPATGAALALALVLCSVAQCHSSAETPAQANTTKFRILVLNLPDAISHQFVFFKVRSATWSVLPRWCVAR